ncbi:MAG: hypothetical protein M1822_003745 [Bathelium mastoideum]|nr:MAG: hypothetical protein M1822_003745 [Bathelium mastoideum]
MAPLTRMRATDDHVPGPLAKAYYSQRASVPGTLIFSEGTQVSPFPGGFPNAPGIWNDAQVAAWKDIVAGVHANRSFIFAQLFGAGRAAFEEDGLDIIGSSPIPIDESHPTPRELTEQEIWKLVADFTQAAKNAMDAGFDGVEIHAAYGHILDQFIQENANQRSDEWGGSIENRCRFPLEILKAVSAAIGKERVGIRLTPFGTWQAMRPKNPIAQFGYLIAEAKKLGIAYLSLVEARVDGDVDVECSDSSDALVSIWTDGQHGPLFLAGGFRPDTARYAVDHKYKGKNVAIIFGRHFTSNPDLIYRVQKGIELAEYKRDIFYKAKSPEGYADWPFSAEFQSELDSPA